MNRKNLTAAVLAGLAGAAGIAGTAQAVNMNPDGLGQVLIYPYYTTNDGNQTILSVVNTTTNAKAVKVRFLEGFNSREVLDFNLYMSKEDVWTAALYDDDGTPTLVTFDNSCTTPYLYETGPQEFLSIAYNDHGIGYNFADGGPTSIARAAEGHFELIEMATIACEADAKDVCTNETYIDVTHQLTAAVKDKDGAVTRPATWEPKDCLQVNKNWYRTNNGSPLGEWTCTTPLTECAKNRIDMSRNSGGLFGGAAIVNGDNGTMFSYNAQAIQGFDKSDGKLHREPGTIHPNLNEGDGNLEGNDHIATVFFGVPQNTAVDLHYPRSVDAVSAIFMHENLMNEYTVEEVASASTEWVVTFPTKNFYVDPLHIFPNESSATYYFPTIGAPNCAGWVPGNPNPVSEWNPGGTESGDPNNNPPTGWTECYFDSVTVLGDAVEPFSSTFDGEACETVSLQTWDREERTFSETIDPGVKPPVVSPSLPCIGESCSPEVVQFQLCYETNVLRFGEGSIFGTPNFYDGASTGDEYYGLLVSVTDEYENGWGRIDLHYPAGEPLSWDGLYHQDWVGLVGLPATGFAAQEFENNFLEGGTVKAYYGGLFMHRGNVRRVQPLEDDRCGRHCSHGSFD